MAWEAMQSLSGATLWRNREQGFWRVTRDRDGRPVGPRNDLNHLRTKKAALELWREKQDEMRLRIKIVSCAVRFDAAAENLQVVA